MDTSNGHGAARRPGGRRRVPAAPLAPLALIALAVTAGQGWSGFDSAAGQAISCCLNGGMAVALLAWRRPSLDWWRRTAPVLLPAVGALLWAIVATRLTAPAWPDYATGKVLACAGALAALVGGALCGTMRRRRPLGDVLMLFVAGFLVLGLMAWHGGMVDRALMRNGRFTGLIGNANVTAAFAGALAIFALARLTEPARYHFERRPQLVIAGYVPAFTVAIGVVVIAASRFASLVLGAMLAGLVLEWALRTRTRLRPDTVLVASGVAVAVLIVVTQFSGLLRFRLESIGNGGADRVATWSHLLDVWGESPWLGYGLGSFPTVNAHYLTTPRFAQANWALNSPHDLLLQFLLQAGLPYAVLILTAVAAAVAGVRRRGLARLRREDWVLLLLIAFFVVNATVDVTLDMPAPVTFVLFLLGLVWGPSLRATKVPNGDAPGQRGA